MNTNMKIKTILIPLLFVTAALSLFVVLKLSERHEKPSGTPAPDFSLEDKTRSKKSLADYRGKNLILNFWMTTCPPCVGEMDSLERMYQKFKGSDFEMVGISVDDNWVAVEKFFITKKVSFPILLDPKGDASNLYQVYGVPETVLINKEGKIVEKISGPREWDQKPMMGRIEKFIHEGK